MKTPLRLFLFGLLPALVSAADVPAPVPAPAAPKVHIVLVGDSTVNDGGGWGFGFREFVTEDVRVTNTAQNGRSSKSFRAEGHWDKALAAKGDYYLIQFGHNDQPGKGPERETDPATTYTGNMARYVDEVRAQGGQPVLVTSLTRRNFSKADPKRIESTLTPWVEAVRKLAAAKQVPLIDLHASSIAWCESIGPERTAELDFPDQTGKNDTTHLKGEGRVVFARLVVDGLRKAVPALAPVLVAEPHAAKLTDIPYGEAGGQKLLLDVSVPAGAGPHPVAILVHGGGWSRGDKFRVPAGDAADITPMFAPLTDGKFTWFSINYRHAPQHRWPACLEDVQTAIRWVKAHAAEYGGDPARIALFGHSAGGHLVCLAATLADDSVRVQAVVGYSPVTNHEQDLPVRGGLSTSLQALLNRPKALTPESLGLLREISPLNHVRPGLPPFLLIHAELDKSVPLQQSLDFQAKIRAAGGTCDLEVVPGAGHALANWGQLAPGYPGRMVAWLGEHLRADPPPAAAAP